MFVCLCVARGRAAEGARRGADGASARAFLPKTTDDRPDFWCDESKQRNVRRENSPSFFFLYLGFQISRKKDDDEKRGIFFFLIRGVGISRHFYIIYDCTHNYYYSSSSSWLRRRHKNSSPRTTASTVRTRKRGLFFFRFVMNRDTILFFFFLICITPLRTQFDVLFSLYSLTTKTKQA